MCCVCLPRPPPAAASRCPQVRSNAAFAWVRSLVCPGRGLQTTRKRSSPSGIAPASLRHRLTGPPWQGWLASHGGEWSCGAPDRANSRAQVIRRQARRTEEEASVFEEERREVQTARRPYQAPYICHRGRLAHVCCDERICLRTCCTCFAERKVVRLEAPQPAAATSGAPRQRTPANDHLDLR
jgi:hypothetical protein